MVRRYRHTVAQQIIFRGALKGNFGLEARIMLDDVRITPGSGPFSALAFMSAYTSEH